MIRIDGCGRFFDESGWVVRFCVDVKRLVVRFSVRLEETARQVECDIDLVDWFWVALDCLGLFRGFFIPLQEFVVHFKTGKNLWLTFVRFWLFKRWQTCLIFFRDACLVFLGKNCRLALFPRLCHFLFSSMRFLVLLSVRDFLKFSKN